MLAGIVPAARTLTLSLYVLLVPPAPHFPVNQLFLLLIEILLPLLADLLEEYVLNSVGELGIAKISCTEGRIAASCLLKVAEDRSLLLSVGSGKDKTSINEMSKIKISTPLIEI